jgi:hypothetical protein
MLGWMKGMFLLESREKVRRKKKKKKKKKKKNIRLSEMVVSLFERYWANTLFYCLSN